MSVRFRHFSPASLLLFLLLLPCPVRAEGVTPFVHPGLLNNLDELEFIKDKVTRNQEPWKSGYEMLLTQAGSLTAPDSVDMRSLSALAYKPSPCSSMKTDTDDYRTDPCVNQLKNDTIAAHNHALQWYIKGDSAHAQKAVEILNAWSSELKSWTGTRRRYAGYLISPMVWSAEIIRYTYTDNGGWRKTDVDRFKAMLDNIVWQFIKDGHPAPMNARFSNQESSVVMGKIAIAIFLDDRAKFDDALAHYRRHLANNIYLNHPTQPDFKNYETCRDLGHAQLSLGHLTMAAEMAWKQGVDLYGERKNSLLKSAEFQVPWMLDEPDKPDAKCLSGDPNPNTQKFVDMRGVSPFYETAYNHYHGRKGMAADRLLRVINIKFLEDIEQVKNKSAKKKRGPTGPYRPERFTATGYGSGTLTHFGLPSYPAGHRPRAAALRK